MAFHLSTTVLSVWGRNKPVRDMLTFFIKCLRWSHIHLKRFRLEFDIVYQQKNFVHQYHELIEGILSDPK